MCRVFMKKWKLLKQQEKYLDYYYRFFDYYVFENRINTGVQSMFPGSSPAAGTQWREAEPGVLFQESVRRGGKLHAEIAKNKSVRA